ncbi:uncharacterized protein LOC102700172 [Oryza brachyantha]|uniref:Uncharacterized protein n=1 Tax=Oryza brachyantha TaxID=4533 RepID=J3MQJ3_ORYBR|nr:uncharacterized protein LOC102700172 [Oryza brachyantha]
MSMDGSIAMHREDKVPGDTRPVSSATACFRVNPLYSGMGSNGRKCSTVKIESPPNKMSETNKIGCGLISQSCITKNVTESKEDIMKNASFSQTLEVGSSGISQDAMTCSKEASPVFHMRPLHMSTGGADPCDSAVDGLKAEPSECSVDSPCWRGTSLSHLASVFDVLQTSNPQLINQESGAFGAGQKKSTSAVQHSEVLIASQNLDTIENKQNQSQSHVELSVSMKSGDIGTSQTKNSHKELESAKQCAAKCTTEQKHSLEVRDNSVKRSGLNFAAPDFVPASVGKLSNIKESASPTGRKMSGILKTMENLSEALRDSCSLDKIGLDEHEHTLLQSIIENLQTCLDQTIKGPIRDGASNKPGLRAPHSQSTILKSDAGNYKGSCTASGGKGITVNKPMGPSHVPNNFGNNSLTWSQPSCNNIPRMTSCEEHSQILVYKNLWIDAERANCKLKYLLKNNLMKIGPESSMAHVGGPRNPSIQACDFESAGPSSSYGGAISYSPTLSFRKDDPTEETSKAMSTGFLYTSDRIRLGDNNVPSCSESINSHPIRPKNFQADI